MEKRTSHHRLQPACDVRCFPVGETINVPRQFTAPHWSFRGERKRTATEGFGNASSLIGQVLPRGTPRCWRLANWLPPRLTLPLRPLGTSLARQSSHRRRTAPCARSFETRRMSMWAGLCKTSANRLLIRSRNVITTLRRRTCTTCAHSW